MHIYDWKNMAFIGTNHLSVSIYLIIYDVYAYLSIYRFICLYISRPIYLSIPIIKIDAFFCKEGLFYAKTYFVTKNVSSSTSHKKTV